MAEKITELARRLRPFLGKLTTRVITQVLNAAEGPGIDIPPDTNTIGLGGDTILLYDSGGNPVAEYPFTEEGLQDALDDATSGDIVWMPAGTIGENVYNEEEHTFDTGFGDWEIYQEVTIGEGDPGTTEYDADHGHNANGCIHSIITPTPGTPAQRRNGVRYSPIGMVVSAGDTVSAWFYKISQSLLGAEDQGCYSYIRIHWTDESETFVNVIHSLGVWSQLIFIIEAADNGKTIDYIDVFGECNSQSIASWYIDDIVITLSSGGGLLTIPAGIELVGLGKNSILNTNIQNSGILTNLKITGNVSGSGILRLVAYPEDETFSKTIFDTAAPGSPPFRVNSSDMVNNLNVDLLDGFHAHEISEMGSGLDWHNVKRYGAIGDGVVDDTNAITSAIEALDAEGRGVLYFPPGIYLTSGGFTLAYPTTVVGCGMGNIDGTSAVTQINCNSETAILFTVTTKSARFRDIALKNVAASTPSAGSGIQISGTYLEQKVDFENVNIYGFWIDADVQVGGQWTANNLFITCPVKYGLKIRNTINDDAGDWSIVNSNFNAGLYNSDAAIRVESSGGAKIANCKINCAPPGDDHKFNHGIDVASAASTVDFFVTNVSIENVLGNGINFVPASGSWPYLIFSNIQFGLYGNSTGNAIKIDGTTGSIDSVVISGCLFVAGTASAAIVLTNIDRVFIAGYVNKSFGTLVSQSGCTNVVIDTGEGGITFNDAEGDPTNVNYTVGADGTSEYAARRDHRHHLSNHTHTISEITDFAPIGQYRQFLYVLDDLGDFEFLVDDDGHPLTALLDLE